MWALGILLLLDCMSTKCVVLLTKMVSLLSLLCVFKEQPLRNPSFHQLPTCASVLAGKFWSHVSYLASKAPSLSLMGIAALEVSGKELKQSSAPLLRKPGNDIGCSCANAHIGPLPEFLASVNGRLCGSSGHINNTTPTDSVWISEVCRGHSVLAL